MSSSDDQSIKPVAILDTGIDPNHDYLKNKLDIRNGSYGLGNFHHLGLPNEVIIQNPNVENQNSHGLHVASILLKDRSDVKLTTYGVLTPSGYNDQGDLNQKFSDFFNKISLDLKARDIKYVNASLGLVPSFNGPPPAVYAQVKSYRAFESSMDKIISENPGILFVCAAGNGGIFGDSVNVDNKEVWKNNYGSFPPIPAAFQHDNLIVVGALATNTLDESFLHTYKLTTFTNFGEKSVDIYAPGKDMLGAALGGGEVAISGTSMSSPYLLNKGVLSIAQINPQLTHQQIKKVLLKTAYIKNLSQPLPATSGGIFYPSRAYAVANLLGEEPHLSIDEAVFKIRKHIYHIGEANNFESIQRLKKLWKERGL